MNRGLAALANNAARSRGGWKVDRERRRKLQRLRLQGREPFQDINLSLRSLAAEIHTGLDPRVLEPGEHDRWSYVVAGRLVARRKHRHATFFDLRDQSGIIELCARRDGMDRVRCSQLLDADIGDIVAAEGAIYVTDNHRLTILVSSSRLLTKALRSPPIRANRADSRPQTQQAVLDLLADDDARKLVKTRSSVAGAVREWMAESLFIEVNSPALPRTARPSVTDLDALTGDSTAQPYFRRCLLGELERVYVLRDCAREGRDECESTTLEWAAAYTDYQGASRQVESIARRIGAAVVPDMRFPRDGDVLDLGGTWRTMTLAEAIMEQCGLDILTTDSSTLARYVGARRLGSGDDDWGSLTNDIYSGLVEPKLAQPTIVYDFPLADGMLARQHPTHDKLACSFKVAVGGIGIASGYSALTDPDEQWARLAARETLGSGDADRAVASRDREVRLLEYGMCPAGCARLDIDRLIMLIIGRDASGDPPSWRLATSHG
jgi:lysyl-tRNA synthetase class 2